MSESYQYMPLQGRGSIRVLDLSPGSPESPSIHCNIRSVNISGKTRPEFEAVSYTWGEDSPPESILCNTDNARLLVSPNCHEMLRTLRDKDKVRTLWVDAICINQSDVEERNDQVKVMGDIYRIASHTVIFLGGSLKGCPNLFQYLAANDNSSPPPNDGIVSELERLFTRPWFSRIWVIQELKNSSSNSRPATFVCGDQTASIGELRDCLSGYAEGTRVILQFPVPLEVYDEIFTRLLSKCSTAAQEMYLLAAETGLCKSSEPKDRIFALTPLVSNRTPELESLIQYNRTIEETLHRFALFLLSGGGLALLWMIRHPHSKNMPSWVPDWTECWGKFHWLEQAQEIMDDFMSSEKYQDFKTGNPGPAGDPHCPLPQCLVVKGVPYSRIHEFGPPIQINQEDNPSRIQAVKDWLSTLESIRTGADRPGWPDSIKQALRRISKVDIYHLFRTSPNSQLDLIDGQFVTVGDGEITNEVSGNIANSCNESRIFITEDGRLGRCTDKAKPCDLVCLIKGTIQPCVLREKDHDKWTIVSGECVLLDMERDYPEIGPPVRGFDPLEIIRQGLGPGDIDPKGGWFYEYMTEVIEDEEKEGKLKEFTIW
ncbi:HET-domain-containing protein [Nemania abortiva]|nr:HET-domain-containing protein [Nemania abortiva]